MVQHPVQLDSPTTTGAKFTYILILILMISLFMAALWLALMLLNRIRDTPSEPSLVITEKAMVFNVYHHFPCDTIVHLYLFSMP